MENTPFDNESGKPNIISQYERLTTTNANVYLDVDDYERIAEHYMSSAKHKEALKVIDKGLKQHFYNVALYRLKATIYIAEGKFQYALNVIQSAFALSPEDHLLKLLEIECIAFLGNEREALGRLNTLKDAYSDEDKIDALFVQAKIYERMSDFGAIFETLEEVLAIDPSNPTALEKIWFCVELSGKYDESILLHQSIIDEQPYNYLAWYNLGHAYTCTDELDKALMSYEYSFLINEDFEFGYRDYTEILITKGEFKKALETLEEIKDKFGKDAELYLNLGQCHLHLEDYDTAYKYLIKAKEYNPLEAKIYFLLGLCEMAGTNYDSAIYYLSIAIELDNLKEEYYEALSSTHMLKGDFDAAIQALKQAIEIAPEHWHFTIELSKLYIELFEYEKAYNTLTNVADLLDAPEVRYCLAVCHILMGDEARGMELLNKELKMSFEHHEILNQLNIPIQYHEVIDDLIAQHHA